ncbi:carbohydrate esterase family 4 [Lecanosticta acicola]|uniref:chitin deacetylase n=1 Tax=Lecanosticta acicola TaxID=111012 RepID=A0AAI8W0H3_9PEZI|nr:carbohydrate esterase family 4 [Lecanosticta acicola]
MAIQTSILTIVLLVIIPLYIIYKPPKFVIGYFARSFPEVLFQVDTTKKIVALTIDDAPSPYTRPILDSLKANDATATFFVIGNQVPGNEDILKDILASGSELGNHAMHDEPSISLPSEELQAQIKQVDGYIDKAYEGLDYQRSTYHFRPGSGIFSRRILDVAIRAGYRTILGSIYPHDPFIGVWWINAYHILSMLRPGAVIICHDRRSWTVPMLNKVLPRMKKKGYEVVSVSRFLEMTKI